MPRYALQIQQRNAAREDNFDRLHRDGGPTIAAFVLLPVIVALAFVAPTFFGRILSLLVRRIPVYLTICALSSLYATVLLILLLLRAISEGTSIFFLLLNFGILYRAILYLKTGQGELRSQGRVCCP
jgi:hypothetical protein